VGETLEIGWIVVFKLGKGAEWMSTEYETTEVFQRRSEDTEMDDVVAV
jgi:hypothetical protein